jgi:hypothetical protein
MPPSMTHDISRIGWHMKDLECFAKDVEIVSYPEFKNAGLIRYVRQSALPFQITVHLATILST